MRPSSSLALFGLAATAQAAVKYLGVAMVGGDFGCDITGYCPLKTATIPLERLGHADGSGQMNHFVNADGVNLFRLPTSWQFLINNDETVSTTFDKTNFERYGYFVEACLDTGAYCMIDIHNFARFNGGIVGQGGPTDDMFVTIWTTMAKKYAKEEKVIFQITNEPHDLDTSIWAATCQKVVTAIREAGATSQMILLPGSNFASAATITTTGGADALLEITNPDGSYDGLVLDVHKYLDNDNSGQNEECTTDNVGNFSVVADYLRAKKRTALISETGASDSPSCMTDFLEQNTFLNANDDVFIGIVAWGAGQFDSTYVLSVTPTKLAGGKWEDNAVFKQCVLAPFQSAGGALPVSHSITSSAASSTSSKSAASSTLSASTTAAANLNGAKGSSNTPATTTVASAEATSTSKSPAATNAPHARTVQVIKSVVVLMAARAALM